MLYLNHFSEDVASLFLDTNKMHLVFKIPCLYSMTADNQIFLINFQVQGINPITSMNEANNYTLYLIKIIAEDPEQKQNIVDV